MRFHLKAELLESRATPSSLLLGMGEAAMEDPPEEEEPYFPPPPPPEPEPLEPWQYPEGEAPPPPSNENPYIPPAVAVEDGGIYVG